MADIEEIPAYQEAQAMLSKIAKAKEFMGICFRNVVHDFPLTEHEIKTASAYIAEVMGELFYDIEIIANHTIETLKRENKEAV